MKPRSEFGYNHKRDNRRAKRQDIYTPQGIDACQTPLYALDPLLPYFYPKIKSEWTIWEPASGEGLLVRGLEKFFPRVIASDILEGQNFFDYEPEGWDCLVTNPPYSIKYKWLKRCYELGKPFALLVPVETIGAWSAQKLMQEFGFELMLLRRRVNFKTPTKKWEGGALFPTLWFCWKLLPSPIVFGNIEPRNPEE